MQIFSPCATITLPNGQLAQLVERLLDVERVRGSSPLLSTKNDLNQVDLGRFYVFCERESKNMHHAPHRGVHYAAEKAVRPPLSTRKT